ncbi:MAG: EamA family transporter [Chitinophagales bacterium]
MNWLFPALLSPAVYSIVNFVDKYIVCGRGINYRGVPIYSAIVATVFGLFIWIYNGYPLLNFLDTILVLLSGSLSLWASALYFKAISRDTTSKIIIMLQIVPVMVLGLSVVFLNESITPRQLIGFIVIMLSAVGLNLSLSSEDHGSFWGSTLGLILISDFMWAISSVVFKFVVGHHTFAELIAYQNWGYTIGGLVLYYFVPGTRIAFQEGLASSRGLIMILILLNEGLYVVGKLLGSWALSLGPASLVSVVGSTQVFFGILYGWLLTLIRPSVFKEDISSSGIRRELIWAIAMLFGVWLV